MARRRGREQGFLLGHYVNDRPYVASSLLSVAIAQVFGSAMAGRCKERPALAETPIPLTARIEVLPIRGGEGLLQRLFEPLGYTVESERHPLDDEFPDWGESPYYSITISGTKTVADLLTHLYVLIPVFDNAKHYYVGDDELEKLLAKSAGWLTAHPEKEEIARRYLKHRSSLFRAALARLADDAEGELNEDDEANRRPEESLERPLSLNEQRHDAVLAALRACGARKVLDLGCGEGRLLRQLLGEPQFERIVGMDVSVQALQRAAHRIGYDRLPPVQKKRVELIHGSLIYRDQRLSGFDAAAVVEVIEHLDSARLSAFERSLFECARPGTIVLTTPNREYNAVWESLPAGSFRHSDHRFEWTRAEFHAWANRVAERYAYKLRFDPVGPEDSTLGAPTQMAIFTDGRAIAVPAITR
jgi:3' terminal RNA ribose 2'-O-methyltransferase Hen1